MVYFDGDLVATEHIEAKLMGSAALAVEVGYNTDNGQPQVYYVGPPQSGVAQEDPLTGYPPPYVTYYSQSGGSQALETLEDEVVWYNGLWSVIVSGPLGDKGRVDRAALAVLEALHYTDGPTASGYVNECRMTESLNLGTSMDDTGVRFYRKGWTFRIYAQASLV